LNAEQEYQRNAKWIENLIAELQEELEAHALKAAARPADWSYVGTLGHVREGLADLVDFLTGNER
jgi:hypothetical protein